MSGDPSGTGSGPGGPPDDGDLSARLKRLETQLEGRRPKAAPAPARAGTPGGSAQLGQAMRLSTEFIAGVIAGGILGYLFDHLFGTKPWGMIVLLMLGFITGIYNVMRVSGFSGQKAEKDRREGS
ncbi:AtpZ/AtpI family protein [Methylorubrum salsuginis]|uniref:ATP synthase protein I n=1 Tax=Methylorubrum salsuginis TaxID=414703 RepID=A0A1I4F8G6_9HYPH|nr:AtpZ/AtpI family protein [Methylorubrum salsuginis]SFL14275.1 ATP synthase protein I [Methylorubrum salsuginis]